MTEPKQLNITKVKESNKQYSETERIWLDDEYYIDIYPKFDPDKVNDMFEELRQFVQELEKEKIKIDDKTLIYLIDCFIIKTFSKMNMPKKAKTLLQFFIQLKRYEYFDLIMELYPKESITFAMNRFYKGIQAITDMNEKATKMKEQLEQQIKNEEVTNVLADKPLSPIQSVEED